MQLILCTTPAEFPDEDAHNAHVVVIDVLRASSTIVHALANGAAGFVPVARVAEARQRAAERDPAQTLLCGERGGLRVEGFDLGNSPLDYTPEVVRGKTIVFSTSNGTRAVARSAAAQRILVGSFRNLAAVVERLAAERPETAIVVCAGRNGRLSLEDLVCGGLIVDRLLTAAPGSIRIDDAARTARAAAREFGATRAVFESDHGHLLARLGFDADLEFCARVDADDRVPEVLDGVIRVSG